MKTIDELCNYLTAKGYCFTRDGSKIHSCGSIDLSSLTALPAGVSLSAGGWLYLSSLTALPAGVSLSAGGLLYLSSLTALPAGVSLSAGGGLYLSSLTALPAGVSLSAGGLLDLNGLTTEHQRYKGVEIRLRMIDGYAMRLIHAKDLGGGVTLWKAQYFRGDLNNDPRCFIAQQGETYAHGDTAETALRDLRFKLASVDFDPAELVETIKARGTVTFNDYRLLTGACESGLREGLRSKGLDPNTDALPLARAIELCAGEYGGDRFRSLLNEAAQ